MILTSQITILLILNFHEPPYVPEDNVPLSMNSIPYTVTEFSEEARPPVVMLPVPARYNPSCSVIGPLLITSLPLEDA